MAITRKTLKGMGLGRQAQDALLAGHMETVQALLCRLRQAEEAAKLRETIVRGVPVAQPPQGEESITREEILSIRDAGERQAAIARHHALFGF